MKIVAGGAHTYKVLPQIELLRLDVTYRQIHITPLTVMLSKIN